MTQGELLHWAAHWHYPFIVLARKPVDCIPYGEAFWLDFVNHASPTRLTLATQRVRRWNALAEQEEREETRV